MHDRSDFQGPRKQQQQIVRPVPIFVAVDALIIISRDIFRTFQRFLWKLLDRRALHALRRATFHENQIEEASCNPRSIVQTEDTSAVAQPKVARQRWMEGARVALSEMNTTFQKVLAGAKLTSCNTAGCDCTIVHNESHNEIEFREQGASEHAREEERERESIRGESRIHG